MPISSEEPPLDWGLRFFQDEGGNSLTAEVTYREKVVCRLTHQVMDMSPEESREVLLAKVLKWIADYQTRPHSGDTFFGDLEF